VLTLYKVTGEKRHANGILDLETNIKTVAIMKSPKAKLLNVFWKKTEPEQDNPLVVIALTKSISHLFKPPCMLKNHSDDKGIIHIFRDHVSIAVEHMQCLH
jgi:hypothetical protein